MQTFSVTFDTNALADVVSPATSQRPDAAPAAIKVRAALQAGALEGHFCDALILLEGIQNSDRCDVFGSTSLMTSTKHDVLTTSIQILAEQPARKPLHSRQVERFSSAFELGMRLISAPRIGMPRVNDPNGTRYRVDRDGEHLSRRLDRFYDCATAIEGVAWGARRHS